LVGLVAATKPRISFEGSVLRPAAPSIGLHAPSLWRFHAALISEWEQKPSALAAQTSRIGLIATASTTFSDPYNLARQFASFDHLSNGRAGFDMVPQLVGRQQRWAGLLMHIPFIIIFGSHIANMFCAIRMINYYIKCEVVVPETASCPRGSRRPCSHTVA
jgi:Luciferase-like monooxygenase